MSEETLFELPRSQEPAPAPATRPEDARVPRRVGVRNQAEMMVRDLDSLVAEDRAARLISDNVDHVDKERVASGDR